MSEVFIKNLKQYEQQLLDRQRKLRAELAEVNRLLEAVSVEKRKAGLAP